MRGREPDPVLDELADVVRGMRAWETIPMPVPLSSHVVLVTCLLKLEAAEDVRLSIATDAEMLARAKAAARIRSEKEFVRRSLRGRFQTWNAVKDAATMPPPPISSVTECSSATEKRISRTQMAAIKNISMEVQ